MSNKQVQALRDILEIVGRAPVMPKLQKIHSIATNALGENADTDTTPTGWDETATDCRDCKDWDDCFDDKQKNTRDEGDNAEYNAEGCNAFENMHD